MMFDVLLTKLEADCRAVFDASMTGLLATAREQLWDAYKEVVKDNIKVLKQVAKERAEVAVERINGLAEVANERAALRREIEAMQEHKEAQEGRVELNVGGHRFETSVQVLRRVPHTFFDAYFSGRYAQDVCTDGSIFIDRDGEHFVQILQYLRDGVVSVAEQDPLEVDISVLRWLKREFGFYCIDLPAAEKRPEVVYVMGGYRDGDGEDDDGGDNVHILSSMEWRDTASGTWRPAAPMSIARYQFAASNLAKDLYVIGGLTATDMRLASVERYSQSLNAWSTAPSLPQARSNHCACTVGDAIFVLGGRVDGDHGSSSVLKFDSQMQNWSEAPPLPEGLEHAAVCVMGSHIYVFGGAYNMNATATTLCFDTESATWTTLAPMPEAKVDHTACVLEGHIYVLGGIVMGNDKSSVSRYDPVVDSWSAMAPMLSARASLSAFVLGGSIYVAGGWGDRGMQSSVERYCVAFDSWAEVSEMELLNAQTSFGAIATGGETMDLFDSLVAKAEQARLRAAFATGFL
jgi:hypothetical protein